MNAITISDLGTPILIGFEDILKYHGRGFIGGVAHGYKVMERAFTLLSPDTPPDRYAISIETAFPGPGARDAFEMVTRAVTGGRYLLDLELGPSEAIEAARGRYFFRVGYQDRRVELKVRPGIVRDEFIALSRRQDLSGEERAHLEWLKRDMADRIMALPAGEVYEPV